jgi:hypothetical protein
LDERTLGFVVELKMAADGVVVVASTGLVAFVKIDDVDRTFDGAVAGKVEGETRGGVVV